jgi:hypothetical protein
VPPTAPTWHRRATDFPSRSAASALDWTTPPEPPTWVSETLLLRRLEAAIEALPAELRLMEQACREATDSLLQNAALARLESVVGPLLEQRQRLLGWRGPGDAGLCRALLAEACSDLVRQWTRGLRRVARTIADPEAELRKQGLPTKGPAKIEIEILIPLQTPAAMARIVRRLQRRRRAAPGPLLRSAADLFRPLLAIIAAMLLLWVLG